MYFGRLMVKLKLPRTTPQHMTKSSSSVGMVPFILYIRSLGDGRDSFIAISFEDGYHEKDEQPFSDPSLLGSLLVLLRFHFPCKNTLRAGEVMRDGELLESSSLLFQLRFFYLISSSNRYLGIQCTNYVGKKVVWVANRENSLNDTSGVLNMTKDGNLVITDDWGTSTTINSDQPAAKSSSSNTSATLLDSGNLVLRAGDRIVWQSFDYPSDMFLPGMKLGLFSLKTGRLRNQILTSWLSPLNPAPGTFAFGVDPNITKELVIWRRGVLYWRSGIWNGYNFSYLSNENSRLNFRYLSNENESYFTFSVNSGSGFRWIEMDSDGGINKLVPPGNNLSWQSPCDDDKVETRSKGCVTPEPPRCRGGDVFSQIQGIMSSGWEYLDNVSLGLSDCREICVRNCSCIAYASIWSDRTGCQFSQSQKPGTEFPGGKFIYIRNNSTGVVLSHPQPPSPKTGNNSGVVLPHPQSPPPKTRNNTVVEKAPLDHPRKRQLWLIIGAPVVSLIVLTVVEQLYIKGKNGSIKDGISRDIELLTYKAGTSIITIDELSGAHKLELSGKKGHELLLFNFSSIEIATDHFSDANKLGQGGFGPVYKGKLVKGQEIAVKRLSKSSRQGLEEFKNEVVLISKLQHMNLVKLLGCCIQGEERILIYEYLPNNSLDSFIFDLLLCYPQLFLYNLYRFLVAPIVGFLIRVLNAHFVIDATKRALLDWKKCVYIIEGIAQGLLYLHKYSRLKIIHRDLKTSNILLDSDMNPKISDFGTARIFKENDSQTNTNRIVGTYGYMSPEYAIDGLFSVKSDVFSFGVMMLEIISGKKNTGFYKSNRSLNLLGYAWDLYREGRCLELMDPAVEETCSRNEVLRCVQVGLLCVQENAVDRPTMSDVVSMLSNESITLPSPKQPAFSTIVSVNDADLVENPRPCSINNITVSEIEAR